MTPEKIKANIRKVRYEMHLTQQETADRIGISRTAYRNLENGDTRIFSDHITSLARLSGKSEEEIVLGYNPESMAASEKSFNEAFPLQEQISALKEISRLQKMVIESQNREIAALKGKFR